MIYPGIKNGLSIKCDDGYFAIIYRFGEKTGAGLKNKILWIFTLELYSGRFDMNIMELEKLENQNYRSHFLNDIIQKEYQDGLKLDHYITFEQFVSKIMQSSNFQYRLDEVRSYGHVYYKILCWRNSNF